MKTQYTSSEQRELIERVTNPIKRQLRAAQREATEIARRDVIRPLIPKMRLETIAALPAKSQELVDRTPDNFWFNALSYRFPEITDLTERADGFLFAFAIEYHCYCVPYITVDDRYWTQPDHVIALRDHLNDLVGRDNFVLRLNEYRISFGETLDDGDVTIALPLTLAAAAKMRAYQS
jgi:hypothetical protein